jgi:nucleoid DNA-binding protein
MRRRTKDGLVTRAAFKSSSTGVTVQIKARRVVKFRVTKAAKDAILGAK